MARPLAVYIPLQYLECVGVETYPRKDHAGIGPVLLRKRGSSRLALSINQVECDARTPTSLDLIVASRAGITQYILGFSMIQIGNSTKLSPRQLRLTELFSVKRILSSRGFEVLNEGRGADTIVPRMLWTVEEADLIFNIFSNPVKRAELLDLINGSLATVQSDSVAAVRAISGVNFTRDTFSRTFEWFVGELLVRKFGAFSSSYGVDVAQILRNSDGGTSGDFDVLSVLGTMDLLYIECKTGGFSRSKIISMTERARSLHAFASIMFVSSLNIGSLKQQVTGILYPGHAVEVGLKRANIKSVADSEVYFWHDTYFISADESTSNVEPKIRAVLRLMECKKAELNRGVGVSGRRLPRSGV